VWRCVAWGTIPSWPVDEPQIVGGARAVALLNRGSSTRRITMSARAVGLAHARTYRLENLWTHTTAATHGAIGAAAPAHSATLYRVTDS